MKQTLKLTLYYFLYQLGTLSFFTFIYTAIQLCSTYFETQNLVYPENGYTPPFLLTLVALVLSNLIMGWHLVHFKYIDLKQITCNAVSQSSYAAIIPLTLGMMLCINYVTELLQLPNINEELFLQMKNHLTGILSIAVVAPVIEELVFRGAIAGHLFHKWKNPWYGILLSAFVFGVIHGNPAQIPFAFILGILLGWLYYRTGNILPCILLHFINNSISVALMILLPESAESMTDLFGETGAPLSAIAGAVIALYCVYYINKSAYMSPFKTICHTNHQ